MLWFEYYSIKSIKLFFINYNGNENENHLQFDIRLNNAFIVIDQIFGMAYI